MGRFVSLSFIFILAGCASVQMPGYISRADHPYDRTINGSFEKVVSSTAYVLKKKGWTIADEADPFVYERDNRYDNNGYQNLLLMTNVRKHKRILYSTFTRLNVFIHSIGNTCDVEIRASARNDKLAKSILDALEQEISK